MKLLASTLVLFALVAAPAAFACDCEKGKGHTCTDGKACEDGKACHDKACTHGHKGHEKMMGEDAKTTEKPAAEKKAK